MAAIQAIVVGFILGYLALTQCEPGERESLEFYYDPIRHYLIFKRFILTPPHNISCFVVKLNSDEIANVHTDAGLLAVETRAIAMAPFATAVNESTLTGRQHGQCVGRTNTTVTPIDLFTIP